MRKRALFGSILSASAILAVGWQLGATTQSMTAAITTAQVGPASPNNAGSSGTMTKPGTALAPAAPLPNVAPAPAADGSYLGSSSGTPYGQVQVRVTIAGGAIADVAAVHLTDADGRSVQISNRAAPVLRQAVLSAQSANVHMVSGATYTSEAYLSSLQSALDQAGF